MQGEFRQENFGDRGKIELRMRVCFAITSPPARQSGNPNDEEIQAIQIKPSPLSVHSVLASDSAWNRLRSRKTVNAPLRFQDEKERVHWVRGGQSVIVPVGISGGPVGPGPVGAIGHSAGGGFEISFYGSGILGDSGQSLYRGPGDC